MTKDEAIAKITDSLGQPSDGAMLAEHQAYAGRLATALEALNLLPQANPVGQQNENVAQYQNQAATHHRVDAEGTVSTPHPMTESRHGVTPGGNPEGQSWRRQPTPEDTTGAA